MSENALGNDSIFRSEDALERATSSAKHIVDVLAEPRALDHVPPSSVSALADFLERAQALCDGMKYEAARDALDAALDDTHVSGADRTLQQFTELLRPRR